MGEFARRCPCDSIRQDLGEQRRRGWRQRGRKKGGEDASEQNSDPFDAELAAIDALLARSDAVIREARRTGPAKSPRPEYGFKFAG